MSHSAIAFPTLSQSLYPQSLSSGTSVPCWWRLLVVRHVSSQLWIQWNHMRGTWCSYTLNILNFCTTNTVLQEKKNAMPRAKSKKEMSHRESFYLHALQYESFHSIYVCVLSQNRYYMFEWWEENRFQSACHVYVYYIDRCIKNKSSEQQLKDVRERWWRKKDSMDKEGGWGDETEWERMCVRWSIRECRGAVQRAEAGAGPRLLSMQAMHKPSSTWATQSLHDSLLHSCSPLHPCKRYILYAQ